MAGHSIFMHFHWQNLNEKKNGTTGMPYHGRCWWHFGKGSCRTIGFSWNFWTHFCGLGFEVDDEGWCFHASFPPVAFWLHFNGFNILKKLSPKRLSTCLKPPVMLPDERQCKISVHDWAVWINPWSKTMETNFGDPWWIKGVCFHIDDFLLGRIKYSKHLIKTFEISIPMPEGVYPATVKIEECTWKRPRWFAKVREDAWVDVKRPGGIPFPGKGENSWDCGTDGLCGYGCRSTKPEDIIAEGVKSVLNNRRRYGGSVEWKERATA